MSFLGVISSSAISQAVYFRDENSRFRHALVSAETISTPNLSYSRISEQQSQMVNVKSAKTLSIMAQFYTQSVSQSEHLSDAEKTKLLKLIATIDAQDGFLNDTDGSTSGAISLMIRLAEQTNERKEKHFEPMETATAGAIVEKVLNREENLKNQNYILSSRLLIEELFFEMNGTSYAMYHRQEMQSAQALFPG